MAFSDFVTVELPKRPFVALDGRAGQVLVRSSNADRPREMVWADAPSEGLSSVDLVQVYQTVVNPNP